MASKVEAASTEVTCAPEPSSDHVTRVRDAIFELLGLDNGLSHFQMRYDALFQITDDMHELEKFHVTRAQKIMGFIQAASDQSTRRSYIHLLAFEWLYYLQNNIVRCTRTEDYSHLGELEEKKHLCNLGELSRLSTFALGGLDPFPPVSNELKEALKAFDKSPHVDNMKRIWEALIPYFKALPQVNVTSEFEDINKSAEDSLDYCAHRFIALVNIRYHFMLCTWSHHEASARSAELLYRQWLDVITCFRSESQDFQQCVVKLHAAWWWCFVVEQHAPELETQFLISFPSFASDLESVSIVYNEEDLLNSISLIATHINFLSQPGRGELSVTNRELYFSLTKLFFRLSMRLTFGDRFDTESIKLIEVIEVVSNSHPQTSAAEAASEAFNKDLLELLFDLSQFHGLVPSRKMLISFFKSLHNLLVQLEEDPCPEFTTAAPEALEKASFQNDQMHYEHVRHADDFYAALTTSLTALFGLTRPAAESPIAKAICEKYPDDLRPILNREAPFNQAHQPLLDQFLAIVSLIKAQREYLPNSELAQMLRICALLWIEVIRNTALHHIDDFSSGDHAEVFSATSRQICYNVPSYDNALVTTLVLMAPWEFSLAYAFKSGAKQMKTYNLDYPFYNFLGHILRTEFALDPIESTSPQIKAIICNYPHNLKADTWHLCYKQSANKSQTLVQMIRDPNPLIDLSELLQSKKTVQMKAKDKHEVLKGVSDFLLAWLDILIERIDTIKNKSLHGEKKKAKKLIHKEQNRIRAVCKTYRITELQYNQSALEIKKLQFIQTRFALPACTQGIEPHLRTLFQQIGQMSRCFMPTSQFISPDPVHQTQLDRIMHHDENLLKQFYPISMLRALFESCIIELASMKDVTQLPDDAEYLDLVVNFQKVWMGLTLGKAKDPEPLPCLEAANTAKLCYLRADDELKATLKKHGFCDTMLANHPDIPEMGMLTPNLEGRLIKLQFKFLSQHMQLLGQVNTEWPKLKIDPILAQNSIRALESHLLPMLDHIKELSLTLAAHLLETPHCYHQLFDKCMNPIGFRQLLKIQALRVAFETCILDIAEKKVDPHNLLHFLNLWIATINTHELIDNPAQDRQNIIRLCYLKFPYRRLLKKHGFNDYPFKVPSTGLLTPNLDQVLIEIQISCLQSQEAFLWNGKFTPEAEAAMSADRRRKKAIKALTDLKSSI